MPIIMPKGAETEGDPFLGNSMTRMLKFKGRCCSLDFAGHVPPWKCPWYGTDNLWEVLALDLGDERQSKD